MSLCPFEPSQQLNDLGAESSSCLLDSQLVINVWGQHDVKYTKSNLYSLISKDPYESI